MLRLLTFAVALAGSCLAIGLLPADQAKDDKPDLSQEVIPFLAVYPKPVREAILVVAENPALLRRLEKRDAADPLEPILADEPKEVQQAAMLLAKQPEILKILKEHEYATEAIGRAYKDNKDRVREALDEEAKSGEKAADEWANRLGQDADALDQLTPALQAYQQQLGSTAGADAAAIQAGVNLEPNTVNVTSLPAPGFVQYTMNNADLYPALANVMVSQWLGSRNSLAYDQYFSHWWNRYQHHFHDEHLLRGDEERAHRLAEIARFDKKFEKDEHRWDKFKEHEKEFHHLAKVPPPPKDHRPQPSPHGHKAPWVHKPHIQSGSEHKPAHRPQPGKHPVVHRKPPSEHHHLQHAIASHHQAQHHHAEHHAAEHHRR